MEVYQICNVSKCWDYVGITVNSFNERYGSGSGKWWTTTHNRLLKADVQKYGLDNFILIKLAENVETLEELNSLEKQYIKELNCKFPNGYNFDDGGRDRGHPSVDSIKIVSQKCRKVEKFRFKDPNGIIYEPELLVRFCKEHGLTVSCMSELAIGYCTKRGGYPVNQHKGWTRAEEVEIEYHVVSPDGEEIKTNDKMIFFKKCREGSLTAGIAYRLSQGYIKNTSNGWMHPDLAFEKRYIRNPQGEKREIFGWELFNICQSNNIRFKKILTAWVNPTTQHQSHRGWSISHSDTSNKFRKYINWDGEIFIIRDNYFELEEFCKKFNLDIKWMSYLWDEKEIDYKGWMKHKDDMPLITILSPENNQYIITEAYSSSSKFADKFNLDRGCFLNLLKGKCEKYKGWSILGKKLQKSYKKAII